MTALASNGGEFTLSVVEIADIEMPFLEEFFNLNSEYFRGFKVFVKD
jgi:hypothetical protein